MANFDDLVRHEIPGAVAFESGNNGMPKVILTHASGSRVEVYLHGAHITSWTNARGEDLFFLSRESEFAEDKPIRGGIPVIFPQFGAGPLPPHGFARITEWRCSRTQKLPDGDIFLALVLSDSDQTMAMWPHSFSLILGIQLSAGSLTIRMLAANTDEKPFDFKAALHTYFSVADITRASVWGLQGTTFIDSLRDNVREVETRSEIRFAEETDRIYVGAPNCVSISDEGRGRQISIRKSGMPDAVVWNPWIAKSQRMPDFGDDEYLRMVCVETGIIESFMTLDAGQQWRGETVFSSGRL